MGMCLEKARQEHEKGGPCKQGGNASRRRRWPQENFAVDKLPPTANPTPEIKQNLASSPLNVLNNFPFNVLKAATNKFDHKNLLGEGGFGQVYKGWIDTYSITAAKPGEGRVVAIKKLRKEGFQGEDEWMTELTFLSQFEHPNVVILLGYCNQGEERMLVYEYMARGSLASYLSRENAAGLGWSRRVKVALGAAKGLAYLHCRACQPVIHRDLKASNILLDADFNAKLSDFGLARCGPQGDQSHVTTRVLGTPGYFAPEYIITGHLTLMTDVYSFGVVLLEILSGSAAMKRFSNGKVGELAFWAKPYLTKKTELFHIVDKRLRWKIRMEEARQYADITLQCLNMNPKSRPTMIEVVEALERLQLNMNNYDKCSFRTATTPAIQLPMNNYLNNFLLN